MSTVKFFNAEKGDMSYIRHNSSNFSIIDCNFPNDENLKLEILKEFKDIREDKNVFRFISTHPDEDHIHGIEYIDDYIGINNFYCVKNNAKKSENTDSFNKYVELKDSSKAFFITKGCSRKWMNVGDDENGSSGISILWPDTNNDIFKKELSMVNDSTVSPNNISAIIKYSLQDGAKFMWMGDLETNFMDSIKEDVSWPSVDILLAPHHGRNSGYVKADILKQIDPSIIILGYAESKDMNYYSGWNTILKKHSGNITMECRDNYIDIWVENKDYKPNISGLSLFNVGSRHSELKYIGSINTKS